MVRRFFSVAGAPHSRFASDPPLHNPAALWVRMAKREGVTPAPLLAPTSPPRSLGHPLQNSQNPSASPRLHFRPAGRNETTCYLPSRRLAAARRIHHLQSLQHILKFQSPSVRSGNHLPARTETRDMIDVVVGAILAGLLSLE